MLAPSREASGKTAKRFIVSRSDSAYGRGDCFGGADRPADRLLGISGCVQHLLAVFGAALSGAWVQMRTRRTRENASTFALVCSTSANSPPTG
jgi:hypothetical protein